jgi:hypothetical protein
MTDHKPALAALVAQVLDRRYPKQPFEGSEKEDWLRSAMEGDPIVLLEAAWEWREQHREGGFRPRIPRPTPTDHKPALVKSATAGCATEPRT